MSAQEMERLLGQQYAQALAQNPHAHSLREDCEAVINDSLNLLEHYNKVALFMRTKLTGRHGSTGQFT
jgi:hypothetical protein